MPIIVKDSPSTFTPAPEGSFLSVCVDVVDLGDVKTTWNNVEKIVPKVRLVFALSEQMDDGRPFIASEQYTASLSEKANLRKALETWRGRAFTPDELKGFDLESVIGANAIVQIVHAAKGDRTYANIKGIVKPLKGMAKMEIPAEYVRVKDREPRQPAPVPPGNDAPPPDDADAAPFDDEFDDQMPF